MSGRVHNFKKFKIHVVNKSGDGRCVGSQNLGGYLNSSLSENTYWPQGGATSVVQTKLKGKNMKYYSEKYAFNSGDQSEGQNGSTAEKSSKRQIREDLLVLILTDSEVNPPNS